MSETPLDHYDVYYADKLWALLPAVYRAEDTAEFGAKGPLRELVDRVGVTAAALRRSIDRLWEDQSIETCDDWVIPYIARAGRYAPDPGPGRARPAARCRQHDRLPPPQGHAWRAGADRLGHQRLGRQGGRVLPPPRRARRHGLDPAIGPAATASRPTSASCSAPRA